MADQEEKKAPPPVPSRSQRKSIQIDDTQQLAEQTEQQLEVTDEDYEPVDLVNGEAAVEETVAPNCYKWYRVVVEGKEDDIVDFHVSRTLTAGAVNLYVNLPTTEDYPTREAHDWNPTKGQLFGPPGEYKVAVEGVPSFIEKDDKYLVDPHSNWATFDLLVEYTLLDAKTKETQQKMKDLYSREKTGTVWSSGYNKEVSDKYVEQQKAYDEELKEREKQLQEATEADVSLDGTPVTAAYELGTVLGRGDFTVVKKGKEKTSGKEYAVKIVNKAMATDMGIEPAVLKQQVEILKSVQHKNIATLKEHFDTGNALCLVVDLLEGGEIVPRLASSTGSYTENDARGIVSQLLEAVEHLHSNKIIHKSIIPENVVFSKKEGAEIKLVGFSLAQTTNEDKEVGVSGGDPGFQAPELITQQEYGRPVDMWSIGVMTYLLLTGNRPFHDANSMKLNQKIRQAQYEIPAEISAEAKEFLQKLLCVDASARLTAAQAKEHQWVKKSGDGPALPNVRNNLKKYNDE